MEKMWMMEKCRWNRTSSSAKIEPGHHRNRSLQQHIGRVWGRESRAVVVVVGSVVAAVVAEEKAAGGVADGMKKGAN
jgi:hypothetical protein